MGAGAELTSIGGRVGGHLCRYMAVARGVAAREDLATALTTRRNQVRQIGGQPTSIPEGETRQILAQQQLLAEGNGRTPDARVQPDELLPAVHRESLAPAR